MFKKLLGLFGRDEISKPDLPPDVRAVFDRMAGKQPAGMPGTPCLVCGGPRGPNDGYQCGACTEFMRSNDNNSIHGCGGCGAGFVVAPNVDIFTFSSDGVARVMCACCQEYLRSGVAGGNMPMPKMGAGYDPEGQDLNRTHPNLALREKLARRTHQAQLRTLVESKARRTGVPVPPPILLEEDEDAGRAPPPPQVPEPTAQELFADPLNKALFGTFIESVVQERLRYEATGERPETRLIPHISIKLDIMVKAYESDLRESIEAVKRENMSEAARAAEIKRIQSEIEALIYRLKRQPSQSIEALFEKMKSARALKKVEREVRAEKPYYNGVDGLKESLT
jgi:hypothetical protein